MSYYFICLVIFILLAIIWSHDNTLNFLIKVTFVAMAVWSAMRLFLSKGP